MSKSNRKISSKDVQSILGKNTSTKIRLPLFIKKSNDESAEFYYMGDVQPNHNLVEQTTMKNDKGKDVSVVKIRFDLEDPVPENLYKYITKNESSLIKQESSTSIIETEKKEIDTPIFKIPLYNFYAAAGTFSDMQSEKDYDMIATDLDYDADDYFACKVVGESMNRRIPNGAFCLFKKYTGGSRSGKIVLVENFDFQDPDFNSAFTIKTYSSQKQITEEGWTHTSIILSPNSYDDTFENIVIDESNGENMRVIGEFVKVLSDEQLVLDI